MSAMDLLSIDFPGHEVPVTQAKADSDADDDSGAKDSRSRARSLKKRGDWKGARALLEEALGKATDALERAKLEADLGELRASAESLETRELDPAPFRAPPLPDEDGII